MTYAMPKLVQDPEKISDFLIKKISEGEEKFLIAEINNKAEIDQLRNDYSRWKSYNIAYLEAAFSNNQLSCDYKNSRVSLEVIISSTPFAKHLKDFKDEVKSNIQALKEILDKLPLYETQEIKKDEQMNLLALCKEKVSVLRTDGSKHHEVPAWYTGKMILIPDVSIPIALNDVISRRLPSGIDERSIVTNPGYFDQTGGMPPHYQVKFKIEGSEPTGRMLINTINIEGNSSRVNINSVDNSTNTIHIDHDDLDLKELAKELIQLRNALLSRAETAEHYTIIGTIASAERDAEARDSSSDIKKTLLKLGSGAQWVLEVAKEIGVPIAIEVIKKTYLL